MNKDHYDDLIENCSILEEYIFENEASFSRTAEQIQILEAEILAVEHRLTGSNQYGHTSLNIRLHVLTSVRYMYRKYALRTLESLKDLYKELKSLENHIHMTAT